jgi:rod shape-determining protein MreC
MISLHNKKIGNNKKILGGVIIALLLLMAFFKEQVNHIISVPVLTIGQVSISASDDATNWWSNSLAYFKKKSSIEKENNQLKERINELESKNLFYQNTEKENDDLRTSLFRATAKNKEYIFAAILKRPPEVPYDTAILDSGSEDGVSVGMVVTAYGETLIGHVAEVFSTTSKVRLISFPQEETSVILSGSNTAISAKGRGGENLEISLPREIVVNTGDLITTPGLGGLVVGTVEKIESDPSKPFQKIIFRLPTNIRQLRSVMIEK